MECGPPKVAAVLLVANKDAVTKLSDIFPLQIACQVVTAFLHYLFLAVFCWMLCEGVMLYLMLVVVFSSLSKKWWFFMLLGWCK